MLVTHKNVLTIRLILFEYILTNTVDASIHVDELFIQRDDIIQQLDRLHEDTRPSFLFFFFF